MASDGGGRAPCFASLLSLPLTADYAPLHRVARAAEAADPHVLLTMLLRIADPAAVLFVMEDLHWVDPSTLEF